MNRFLTDRWEVVREPKFVGETRERAQSVLASWGVIQDQDVDDVLLMLSELVTNAMTHGKGEIFVSLYLDRHQSILTGAVGDSDTAWPFEQEGAERTESEPTKGELIEGGRGLSIVAELSTKWGVTRTADNIGKIVWFCCAISPSCPKCAPCPKCAA